MRFYDAVCSTVVMTDRGARHIRRVDARTMESW
jgi:hypothetical protein